MCRGHQATPPGTGEPKGGTAFYGNPVASFGDRKVDEAVVTRGKGCGSELALDRKVRAKPIGNGERYRSTCTVNVSMVEVVSEEMPSTHGTRKCSNDWYN